MAASPANHGSLLHPECASCLRCLAFPQKHRMVTLDVYRPDVWAISVPGRLTRINGRIRAIVVADE